MVTPVRRAALIAVLLIVPGCAAKAPPSLSPAGVRVWQANEAVIAIGSVQRVAIQLNAVQRCSESNVCEPVLSDRNTRIVVDSVTAGLTAIRNVPEGWRSTGIGSLDVIAMQLDANGQAKLAAYLQAARAALIALGGTP